MNRQDAAGWQPIETAPRGGDARGWARYVLLVAWYPRGSATTDIVYDWWQEPAGSLPGCWARWPHDFPPTHWMPAPIPPEKPHAD